MQTSITIIAWIFSKPNSQHLFDGMIDAKQRKDISQNPKDMNSKTIYRSVNATQGIEFTWSVWLYINNIANGSSYQHIFHKGQPTNNINAYNGINFPNNGPGMYLSPGKNELTVVMDTYNNIGEQIIIPNIPLNKWLNVIIRCKDKTIDIYINGVVAKSVNLFGVPRQNYGDVIVAMNNGFDGFISNLWYFGSALGTTGIHNIVKRGPNTKMVGSKSMSLKNPDYLSLRWYFAGNSDGFNP